MALRKQKRLPPPNSLSRDFAKLLKVNRFSNKFKAVERLIWFEGVERRECNGEHTYQLVDIAWFLRDRIAPHLSFEKITKYAMVHDIPEVYAGETPAFQDKTGKHKSDLVHSDKKARETLAIKRLEQEFSIDFPGKIDALHAYERQKDEESRFVYALDKLLAEINIYQDGGRTDKELRVTFEEKMAYKSPKVAKHPAIQALHKEFMAHIETYRRDILYDPMKYPL